MYRQNLLKKQNATTPVLNAAEAESKATGCRYLAAALNWLLGGYIFVLGVAVVFALTLEGPALEEEAFSISRNARVRPSVAWYAAVTSPLVKAEHRSIYCISHSKQGCQNGKLLTIAKEDGLVLAWDGCIFCYIQSPCVSFFIRWWWERRWRGRHLFS